MRRKQAWAAVVALLLVAAGVVAWRQWGAWPVRQPPARVPAVVVQAPQPAVDVSPQPGAGLSAAELAGIHAAMAEQPGFASDLVFLVVASARDRCQPAHAGELARMANRAQLPVLHGVSRVTGVQPALDQPIYRYVQAAADAVVCGRSLRLAEQPVVELEGYARNFPDSYFAPGRQGDAPREYAGRSLAERAAQPCQTIAYVVLPLSAPDWRCDASRAGARQRIEHLCETARAADARLAVSGELSAAFGERLTAPVQDILAGMPQQCR